MWCIDVHRFFQFSFLSTFAQGSHMVALEPKWFSEKEHEVIPFSFYPQICCPRPGPPIPMCDNKILMAETFNDSDMVFLTERNRTFAQKLKTACHTEMEVCTALRVESPRGSVCPSEVGGCRQIWTLSTHCGNFPPSRWSPKGSNLTV